MTTTVAVPGTEVLIDEDQNEYIHTLQHAKKDHGRILLVPQPSLTDPNDPLRWSVTKKWIVFANGLAWTFLASFIGPMMSGGMVQQAEFFGVPIAKLAWSATIALFTSGLSTLFMVPLAVKYGRRPVLLWSTLTMIVGCVWCAEASKTTYGPFFVARAFAGFFAGPTEAMVPSTITDIFFLHDRGEKISIYGLSILGGNELGPVVSAYIIQSLGMIWAYRILAIAIAVLFICMFFTMPETAFHGPRPSIIPPSAMDSTTTVPAATTEKTEPDTVSNVHAKSGPGSQVSTDAETGIIEVPKHSYARSLLPFNPAHINHGVTFRKAFLRPGVLICYPTILWATVVYGMSLCWNVVLAVTTAQLFAPPPYSFESGAQGLVFISPFIGSMVGTYLCGPLSDQIATYYTRRNNGIREPEMRLPMAAVACFLTFAGVAIAGPCYYYKTHWIGPIFGFGVLSAGAQMGANLSMAYALDCHTELSGELMITISFWKSTLAWAWSWFINDWVELNGMMTVYFIIAVINTVVYASTIPLYYKGKAIRIWIAQKNLLAKTGLD